MIAQATTIAATNQKAMRRMVTIQPSEVRGLNIQGAMKANRPGLECHQRTRELVRYRHPRYQSTQHRKSACSCEHTEHEAQVRHRAVTRMRGLGELIHGLDKIEVHGLIPY